MLNNEPNDGRWYVYAGFGCFLSCIGLAVLIMAWVQLLK